MANTYASIFNLVFSFDPGIDVGFYGGLSCSRASDYGLMKIDDKGRVLYFNEKPRGADLESMVCLVYFNPLSLLCQSSFFQRPAK